MRYWYLSSPAPRAFFVSKPAGAIFASFSSNRMGRIAAWGQTRAHWLHWMQAEIFHSGTSTAAPRFSYLEVPAGQVPSSKPYFFMMETGRLSPSWRFMTATTSLINAGELSSTGASSAFNQDWGIVISFSSLIPWSMEALFMSTTAWPFFL